MRSTLALALFLAACGGSSKPASTTPASDEQEEISYEDVPGEEGAADDDDDDAPPTEHAAWPMLGVAECDELLTKTRCSFDKAGDQIPPETWKAMEDSIPAWVDALANPQTRQPTIDACKMSLDAAKDGFAAQGC